MKTNLFQTLFFFLTLISLFLFVLLHTSHAESNAISYEQQIISVGKVKIKLNTLKIPKSSEYSLKVVPSLPIGTVSDLKTLVSKNNGVAGINGSFFEAYDSNDVKRYPNGILIDKDRIYRAGKNTSLISTGSGIYIGNLTMKISGGINGSYKWPNNWYAWNINHVYPSQDTQVVIYTSDFGKTPDDGFINVVVDNSKVVDICSTPVIAPKLGYVIHIGSSEEIKDRFKIGDEIEYKIEYELDGKPLNQYIDTALGAGPKLLSNGDVDIDFNRDGFSSEKIKTLRSPRSFVGIYKDGRLVIGTTPRASIYELAQALKKAGLTHAMNLDGGASSGLFFNDKYISVPGRKISNALIVVKNTLKTAHVVIKDKDLGAIGIIRNGTTFVPVRGVLEELDIEVKWDSLNSTITCRKQDEYITLTTGTENSSDCIIVNSKAYVPLRTVAQKFGYKISWNSHQQRVVIN